MKKYLFALIIGVFALVSCEKEDTVTVEAVTLDVTDVTIDHFKFAAKFTIKGDGKTPCNYGIFVGDQPGLASGKAMITENIYASEPGTYNYSYDFNNSFNIIPSINTYKFNPGTTLYYRAGIEVITADGSTWYYGDEKSFAIPKM